MVGNGKRKAGGKTASPTVPKTTGGAKTSIPPLNEGYKYPAAKDVPSREERIEEASTRSKERNAMILERLAKL